MILKINKQKLHKVHEINDNVRNNCLFIDPKIEDSIGEQIISNKITYSGIRQYNPKKPVKCTTFLVTVVRLEIVKNVLDRTLY